MSSTVIKVEHLSKQYMLSHQSQERYTSLRDVLTNGVKHLSRKLMTPFSLNSSQDHLATSQEEFYALRDVSFEINQGDRVGIIGRNGAGKSTLLKILSRITEPSSGRVTINGRVASLLEVGTGFHPELTGRENIYLNGAILGMSRVDIKRKFDEIVAFAEVEKFLDTPVKRYSSGMYVRLAFAVAAHLEPEILIVDEVLAVGDAQFQKKCLGKMEDVGNEGRTLLFVSHNTSSVNRLCNKGLLLHCGKVVREGDAREVVSFYINSSLQDLKCQAEIPVNENKPFQVLAIYIRDLSGEVINNVIEVDDSFMVNILYKLEKPLPGGYAGFAIKNCHGDIVFQSDSRDSSKSIEFENAGIMNVSIQFPAPILAPGMYKIEAAICEQGRGGLDSSGDAVQIQIVNSNSVRTTWAGDVHFPLVWGSIGDK